MIALAFLILMKEAIMVKKFNRKLFQMILTLAITSVAFMTSLFAWFVDNDSVDSSILAKAANLNISELKLERYKFESNTTSYSLSDFSSKNYVDNYSQINAFDLINSYDKIFYVISFYAQADSIINLSMKSVSSRSKTFFKENDMYYNYYSNVSSFSYFTADESSKLIQSAFSDGTQIKSFDYEMSGNQNQALVSNFPIKAKNNYSFYFLADYDVDYINYLFSDNIGIDCETVLFKDDIQFVLS
jgi:hypothetical protein